MNDKDIINIINNKIDQLSDEKILKLFNNLENEKILFKNNLNNIRDGIIITSKNGSISFINDMAKTMLDINYQINNLKGFKVNGKELYKDKYKNLEYTISKTLNYENKKLNLIVNPDRKQNKLTFTIIDKTAYYKSQVMITNHYKSMQKIIKYLNKEINTSLNSIGFLFELIQKNNFDINDLKEGKEEIKNISASINKLFNSFIGTNLVFEKINLIKLIEKMISILKYDIEERKIKINFDVIDKVDEIIANKESLQKVITAILKNSLKSLKDNDFIEIKLYKENNFAVIEFKDNGSNIDYNQIYRISNPFYTTYSDNPEFNLSLASNLIYKHLGDIEIQNIKDKYKIIKLILPLRSLNQKSLPEFNEFDYYE